MICIDRNAAIKHNEILTVNTKEYGEIDVVPVEYLQNLPVIDIRDPFEFSKFNIGDICIYTYFPSAKSTSIVEIIKILDEEYGIAEVKFIRVIEDDSGSGYFKYLQETGKTMNVSLKFLEVVNPNTI